MRLVFFVQASATIGLGHLMRCLALAQAATRQNIEVVFLLDRETQRFARARADWTGVIIEHDYSQSLEEQFERQSALLNSGKTWAVIDGYQFDAAFCQYWRTDLCRVLLMDDGIHSEPHCADALLNPAKQDDGVDNHLFGQAYRLLRQEFNSVEPRAVSEREYLAINFGGSDPFGLTLLTLEQLDIQGFSSPIVVVTGSGFAGLQELQKFIQGSTLRIEHAHAVQNMAEVWAGARLAMSAAGGSQFELAVCATPAVLVVVAENQIAASQNAAKEGWCVVEVFQQTNQQERESSIANIVQRTTELWDTPATLHKMQQAVPAGYDANGASQVLQQLKELW